MLLSFFVQSSALSMVCRVTNERKKKKECLVDKRKGGVVEEEGTETHSGGWMHGGREVGMGMNVICR